MLNPPSPLLATTAWPGAERDTAIPPGKPYPIEANPWSGMKWRSAFLVSSRHLKWWMLRRLPAISEAPFSPIIIVGARVQALRAAGMIEASTTRRPSMPLTRSCGSTTAVGSGAHAAGAARMEVGRGAGPDIRLDRRLVVGDRAGSKLCFDQIAYR